MASSNERRFYVVTNLPTGDQGPYSLRELQEHFSAGRIRRTDPVRSGFGTSYGTVEDVLANGSSSSAKAAHPRRTPLPVREVPEEAQQARRPRRLTGPWAWLLGLSAIPVVVILWVILRPVTEVPVPAAVPTPLPVEPAPPAAAVQAAAPTTPVLAPAAPQDQGLLKGSDFSMVPIELFEVWERHDQRGGVAQQVEEDGRTFLRISAQPGQGFLLKQMFQVTKGQRLTLHTRTRLVSTTPGREWWHRARVVVLWEGDAGQEAMTYRDFKPSGQWEDADLPLSTHPTSTQAAIWVGLAECGGVLDIAEVQITATNP